MAFLEGLDDTRVLEAALGFVDEYLRGTSAASNAPTTADSVSLTGSSVDQRVALGEPHNASSRSVSNGFDQGESSGPRQKKTNPNRVRDEAQFELVYLRDKVSELESKLRSLQLSSPAIEAGALASTPLSSFTRMPRVWEEMAVRQSRHREQAEHENARLKVLVERKQKMMVSLCEALQRRFIDQNAKHCRGVGLDTEEQHSIQVVDFHGDIGDFKDLFRRLEAAYQEQDRVFVANGLAHVQFPTDIVQIREVDEKQIEVFASKVLPFGLHDVGEAAWDHFKGIEKHLGNGGLYGKSMKNLDQPFTIIEAYTKEVFSKNLYLREKVSQLEQELNSLQLQPRVKMLSNGQAGEASSLQVSSSPHVLSAWKGVAGRQRQRREDAERENARLRLIVERQRKVAVDLSELLRKRMNECTHVSDPYASDRRLARVIDFHGDIGEFQELFQHLEDAYHEVDDVLQANGLATMDLPTHDVHIREGVGGKYLEFFANKAMPFGRGATSEAAWDHFKGVDKHWGNGGLYEKATKNLDQPYTVLEDFTKEMYSNNSKADMQLKEICSTLCGGGSRHHRVRVESLPHRDQEQGYCGFDLPPSRLRRH